MKRTVSCLLAGILTLSMPVSALAEEKAVTGYDIARDSVMAFSQIESVKGDIDGKVDITLTDKESGTTIPMVYTFDADCQIEKEGVSKLTGALDMEVAGDEESVPFEIYVEKKGDVYISYVYQDGEWVKSEIEEPDGVEIPEERSEAEDQIANALNPYIDFNDGENEKTVSLVLNMEILENICKTLGVSEPETYGEDFGLSNASVVINGIIDAETDLPKQISANIVQDEQSEQDEDAESNGMTFSINEAYANINFESYNEEMEPVEIPEEAKKADEDNSIIDSVLPEETEGKDEEREEGVITTEGGLRIAYNKFGNYDRIYTEDEYIGVESSESYDEPSFSISVFEDEWGNAEESANSERDFDEEYYNNEENGKTDVTVSEVTKTTCGDCAAYVYSYTYTEEDYDYTMNGYSAFVELPTEGYMEVEITCTGDIGDESKVNADLLQELFDHISIETVAD